MNEDVDTKKKRRTSPSQIYKFAIRVLYTCIHIICDARIQNYNNSLHNYFVCICDDDKLHIIGEYLNSMLYYYTKRVAYGSFEIGTIVCIIKLYT